MNVLGLDEENDYGDEEFENNHVDISNDDISNDAFSKLELDLKEEVVL